MPQKIVFIGPVGCGKTSIIARLSRNHFDEAEPPEPTIGGSYEPFRQNDPNPHRRLGLWDTSGDSQWLGLLCHWMRGAVAIVCCYEYRNEESAKKLLEILDANAHVNADAELQTWNPTWFLVATKQDLISGDQFYRDAHPTLSELKLEQARAWAGKSPYVTSSRYSFGIRDLILGFDVHVCEPPKGTDYYSNYFVGIDTHLEEPEQGTFQKAWSYLRENRCHILWAGLFYGPGPTGDINNCLDY